MAGADGDAPGLAWLAGADAGVGAAPQSRRTPTSTPISASSTAAIRSCRTDICSQEPWAGSADLPRACVLDPGLGVPVPRLNWGVNMSTGYMRVVDGTLSTSKVRGMPLSVQSRPSGQVLTGLAGPETDLTSAIPPRQPRDRPAQRVCRSPRRRLSPGLRSPRWPPFVQGPSSSWKPPGGPGRPGRR